MWQDRCRPMLMAGNTLACDHGREHSRRRPGAPGLYGYPDERAASSRRAVRRSKKSPTDARATRPITIRSYAVRSSTISRHHAELVIASRLHGVGTEDLARRWQRDPQTIRRMRQRAERALVRSAVA